MAFIDDCIGEIEKAFKQRTGRDIRADELDDLLGEFMKRRKQKQAMDGISSMDEAIMEAANDYAKDMAEAALIQKRNAAISLKKRLEALDYIKTQFSDQPELGVEALLVGVQRAREGSRASAAGEQEMLKGFYLSGLLADLEKSGAFEIYRSGVMDREVANAMWKLFRKEPIERGIPEQAKAIAEVLHKWQEVARNDANEAGAWIKGMEGYIVRQSHDQYRISQSSREAWRNFIEPKLDWNRIDVPDGQTRQQFLDYAYTGLASGVHMKASDGNGGFTGPRNVAKGMSAERVLHFKSADDWFNYNLEFGTGNLREAVIRGLELNAEKVGLMRKLGPNPEDNLNRIVKSIEKDMYDTGNVAGLDKFNTFANGKMRNQMSAIDGTSRTPVNAMQARVWSTVRALQNMSKLGGAVLSQFGDIPLFAQTMRRNGMSYLGGIGDSMAGLMKGKSSEERRVITNAMGVYHRGLAGDLSSRFSIDDNSIPGHVSKMQQLFFKLNIMAGWTDNQRSAAVMTLGNNLALHKTKDWAGLNPDLKRMLGLYNIDGGKWDIIRKAEFTDPDGYTFISPDKFDDLPDDFFRSYLQSAGKPATDNAIKRFRREVADNLRDYYIDQTGHAVIEPDAKVRSVMQQGTRPGTPMGEIARLIGQFKSFPVAYIYKAIGPEIYGRGSDSIRQALKNPNGEMTAFAHLVAGAVVFGYISMTAKDWAKGRNRRPLDNHKTWAAAFIQGGGAGIYGDFLFGEVKNRFGGGPLNTIAGPTIGGTATTILDLYGRAKEGDDLAAASFKALMSNAPYTNLFYTRMALDYLILHSISEALNPGYLKRIERRIEKENEQTFWARPSRNYADPLGIAR